MCIFTSCQLVDSTKFLYDFNDSCMIILYLVKYEITHVNMLAEQDSNNVTEPGIRNLTEILSRTFSQAAGNLLASKRFFFFTIYLSVEIHRRK